MHIFLHILLVFMDLDIYIDMRYLDLDIYMDMNISINRYLFICPKLNMSQR